LLASYAPEGRSPAFSRSNGRTAPCGLMQ
jgi:hypothetical protein